jgi:hypothetical protein
MYYSFVRLHQTLKVSIEGFATEGEAGRWIRNESAAWLDERRAVPAASARD